MTAATVTTEANHAIPTFVVRPLELADRAAWQPLWDGYNAFYGRHGATALRPEITESTWQRFFDPSEPVFALVAQEVGESGASGALLGLTHYLFHRSTSRIEHSCYLQDLFTAPAQRGRGVATALIEGVYVQAAAAGSKRVYWQTHETNAAGRRVYDKVAKREGFIVYAHDL